MNIMFGKRDEGERIDHSTKAEAKNIIYTVKKEHFISNWLLSLNVNLSMNSSNLEQKKYTEQEYEGGRTDI